MKFKSLALSSQNALAMAMNPRQRKIFGFENIKRHLHAKKRIYGDAAGSIATCNRHTGQAHEHRRENARRQRQEAARAAR